MYSRGFGLIELLLTLVILGVIAGFSYPSYQHYLIRARRIEAESSLLNLSAQLERYYIANGNSYTGATLEKLGSDNYTVNGYYNLSIERLTPNSYVLQAIPQGAQGKSDVVCGSLFLDSAGTKDVNGRGQAKDCW